MTITSIHQSKKIFTFPEAKEIFPLVKSITAKAQNEVSSMMRKLERLSVETPEYTDLRSKIEKKVNQWATKMEKLGCEVKGLWLVDFDNGEGYYCWKHPEENLDHFHSYTEGFATRTRIC